MYGCIVLFLPLSDCGFMFCPQAGDTAVFKQLLPYTECRIGV